MKKVLIIDDASQESFLRILNYQGYKCEQAYSPKEAIKLLNESKFDCIILDLLMYNDSQDLLVSNYFDTGLKLLEHIRQNLKVATPVIISSAVRKAEYLNLKKENIIGVMIKPYLPEDLINMIESRSIT